MSRAFHIDVNALASSGMRALNWRQGIFLLLLFAATLAVAQAQSTATDVRATALETLLLWMPFILQGFVLNLAISILAMALATVLGLALGLMQISRLGLMRVPAHFVTHVLRNSPWLVILFLVMFLTPFQVRLPWGGVMALPDWMKATVAFALPVMANISEIFRGAVASIPTGQWDSAESLAFTRAQTLRWVILPQCVKRMLPPWMNWYALLAMATPMASIMGVHEAIGNTQSAMEAAGGRPEYLFPFYAFLMCLFFAYIYPISVWTRKLESKYGVVD